MAIVKDVWLLPVVRFSPVHGNIQVIPPEVVQDISRDAKLLYKLGLAVQTGVVPIDIVAATIGPAMHARWLTTGARDLRLYMSTKNPSKELKELVSLLLVLYIPSYFNIKMNSHCQEGAINFFNMIEYSKDLKASSRKTVDRVLQDNSFWAHPENILIGMVKDPSKVVRRRASLLIKAARENYNEIEHPRQFKPPMLNFNGKFYYDMIDFDKVQVTEPPLTMELSLEEILGVIEKPLILPHYPCHTQHVERTVPLVTESAMQRIGYVNRHRWIINTIESRKICPALNSKKDDMKMD